MLSSLLLLSMAILVAMAVPGFSFTPAALRHSNKLPAGSRTQASTLRTTQHHMLPADAVNSLLIATIDSDIANIPDNEFASVFAGGIIVMFGGLFSALFVGWIIDSRNLYANIVADSFAQGGDDEEFWKGLSEEEKGKAQELLKKLKASKSGGKDQEGMEALEKTLASSSEYSSEELKPTIAAQQAKSTAEPAKQTKDTGMFSDY